jgi:hypothetical protein
MVQHTSPREEEIPLRGYATLATVFSSGLALLLATLAKERKLPSRWSLGDLVMTGISTGMLARIVTRDRVAMPFRAPFTRYEGPAGAGEVRETPRGHGVRRALGTLLTCPYCAAPWLATAALGALVVRPRATRFVQAILVSATIADLAQQLYAATRKLSS